MAEPKHLQKNIGYPSGSPKGKPKVPSRLSNRDYLIYALTELLDELERSRAFGVFTFRFRTEQGHPQAEINIQHDYQHRNDT